MIRDALGLVLGLIIGIRLTEFWNYSQLGSIRTKIINPEPKELFNDTRILCLVITNPLDYGRKKAKVKSTWGRKCNRLIFLANKDNATTFDVVQEGLENIPENHINNNDWFLRADTETYIIMENLRRFLHRYDPESSLHFGHRLKASFYQGYMSGDAGYVLSRGAVRRLRLFAFNEDTVCDFDLKESSKTEDLEMGFCLKQLGVISGESRDGLGQERFLPLMPQWVGPGLSRWKEYSEAVYFKPTLRDCCSSSLISFHPASEYAFDLWEFFLHRVRVFGHPMEPLRLPQRLDYRAMHAQLRYWSRVGSDNHG